MGDGLTQARTLLHIHRPPPPKKHTHIYNNKTKAYHDLWHRPALVLEGDVVVVVDGDPHGDAQEEGWRGGCLGLGWSVW